MNISQVKKLRKIVRMKKLATNNSKIFVCTMKKTSVNYRMVPTLLPCFYPLRHFKIYNSDLCIALFSVLFKAVHRWLPLKPPAWSRGEEGIHSTPTVQYLKSCWRGRRLGGQLSIATGLKLQGHSTSLKAQYLPSASAVSQMRFICLFTVYDATFWRFLMLHVKLGAIV